MYTQHLTPGYATTPVAVAPGGTVVLHGQWTLAARDLVIDGCQSGHAVGGATGAGAFDYAAGGWQLQSRDWTTHTCRLVAAGTEGGACRATGTASPCLPPRWLSIAGQMALPMTVSEMQHGMVGGMDVQVLDAVEAAESAPPGWLAEHPTGIALGALGLALALFAGRIVQRRAQRPESLVRAQAARLQSRLARAEPVYRGLAGRVRDLATQADQLARSRDRLRARVAAARPADLVARRDELAKRGAAEAAEARVLVDEQIARVDAWRAEAERATSRIDRVLETLRALGTRMDDAVDEPGGVRVESDARALRELEREMAVSLDAVREAEQLAVSRVG